MIELFNSKRGDIYLLNKFDDDHQFIVVSPDDLNRQMPFVSAVMTSAGIMKKRSFEAVRIKAGECGFTKDCVIKCGQIIFLGKKDFAKAKYIGTLSQSIMKKVEEKVKQLFGL